jgi:hypothetical protein
MVKEESFGSWFYRFHSVLAWTHCGGPVTNQPSIAERAWQSKAPQLMVPGKWKDLEEEAILHGGPSTTYFL